MPIFDQGYQHWKGALSGHAWRWLAVSRHGLRTQVRGNYIRLLLIMAWLPALVLVTVLAVWGLFEQGAIGADWLSLFQASGVTENPQAFRPAIWTVAYSFFFQTELYFILLLVTLAGPNLISLDLRYNALPLYLSRPLTRFDYFLGKLGVIAGLVAAVAVLPAAAAYVLGVCFSLDLTVVRDTWRLLPASIGYGLVIVVSAGTLMLALSSLSRRSLYVGITWVGLFLIGWVVAGVLEGIHHDSLEHDIMRRERRPASLARLSARCPTGRAGVVEDRLAAAVLVHGQSLPRRRSALEHRRRLGANRPLPGKAAEATGVDVGPAVGSVAGPPFSAARQRTQPGGLLDVAVPLDLVGGRPGRPVRTFPMHLEPASEIAGPTAMNDIVEFDGVSKWYGNVIGLNKFSVRIGPGITGLLGPNGAGKSTMLQLATGQLRASQGEVRVLGHRTWNNAALMRHIGLCPEQDAFYEWMTGLDFVGTCARLTGMAPRAARAAAERAIAQVGMTEDMRRGIRGYSKGMRQRIKLAQALVHEPRVLFLDEPFSGTDPVARRDLIAVIRGLGESGRSVVVSSHVLHEVEALTRNIILLHRGRLVAEGRIEQIRDLIDGHPHRIVLVTDDYRALAARLVRWEDVRGREDRAPAGRGLDRDPPARRLLHPAARAGPGGRPADPRGLLGGQQPGGRVQVPGEQVGWTL